MSIPVFGSQKVSIVVAHQRKIQLLSQFDEVGVDVQLILNTVSLQFDKEAWFSIRIDSKDLSVPLGFFHQRIPI